MEGGESLPLFMSKVCLNLQESNYFFKVGDYIYFFSTELHRNKFACNYINHRKEVSDKLTKRYKIRCHFNLLADVNLYREIENRGFYIRKIGGGEYKWPDLVALDGQKMTLEPL